MERRKETCYKQSFLERVSEIYMFPIESNDRCYIWQQTLLRNDVTKNKREHREILSFRCVSWCILDVWGHVSMISHKFVPDDGDRHLPPFLKVVYITKNLNFLRFKANPVFSKDLKFDPFGNTGVAIKRRKSYFKRRFSFQHFSWFFCLSKGLYARENLLWNESAVTL